jgi:ribosomal protein S18 acetylase RimI-like enzyme
MEPVIGPVSITTSAALLYELDNSVANTSCYLPARSVAEQADYLKDSDISIAYDGEKPVGFIACKPDGDGYEIQAAVVIPEYQRKGIGKLLMQTVLKKTAGKPLRLVTHPKNTGAIIFYLKNGFEIDGWGDNYYGDGQPRLKLVRN